MFINHSLPALDEMLHYVHMPDGSIEHDRAKSTMDPTAAGENHGDRVIADAVAWRAVGSTPAHDPKKQEADPPYNSMAWRLKISKRKLEDSWL
jgi:hypothetical protein